MTISTWFANEILFTFKTILWTLCIWTIIRIIASKLCIFSRKFLAKTAFNLQTFIAALSIYNHIPTPTTFHFWFCSFTVFCGKKTFDTSIIYQRVIYLWYHALIRIQYCNYCFKKSLCICDIIAKNLGLILPKIAGI